MTGLRHLLSLDWDEIGQALLQAAAEHVANAAATRADVPREAMTLQQTGPDRLRLSIDAADLIRREQGDAVTVPQPFLAPTGQDRAALRDAMIAQLRKTVA